MMNIFAFVYMFLIEFTSAVWIENWLKFIMNLKYLKNYLENIKDQTQFKKYFQKQF